MSSNLYWEPVKPKKGHDLSDTAKFFFRAAFEYEGSPLDVTLGENNKNFLRGAMVATKSDELKADLEKLLDAISKYGEVRIWEQY